MEIISNAQCFRDSLGDLRHAMFIAVEGMLPNNHIGRTSMKRLRVYAGAEHKNQAQKPELYTL